MYMSCGHVGCCDSSRGRHATHHYEQTGHPIMRSVEPCQIWRWCYVDKPLISRRAKSVQNTEQSRVAILEQAQNFPHHGATK
jgi:uncharacterized UBP type Zn finger protein